MNDVLTTIVTESEFARHLGYESDVIPEGRSREVADEIRDWFGDNGRPFAASRRMLVQGSTDACVILEGDVRLNSRTLAARFSEAGVHAVFILGVSAGQALDDEVLRQWDLDHPEMAYALSAFGAAYTEAMVRKESAVLCENVDADGHTLLAHFSPGYEEWDTAEQSLLLDLLKQAHPDLPLEALPSSLLVPQKSQLAVLGITQYTDRVDRNLVPCVGCSLNPCRLRRAPYREGGALPEDPEPKTVSEAEYAFPEKALKRWSSQYLALEQQPEMIQAVFTYHGSTCSDGGIPLVYQYRAELAPVEGDFEIRDLSCAPQEGDRGYPFMCSFKTETESVQKRISNYKPLLGQRLSDVLRWAPARNPAGCLCSQANRNHKWLMALQTMHFALNEE